MKIHIGYTGFLKIREIEKNPVIEMPEGSTIMDLFQRIGLKKDAQRNVQAFINQDAAWKSTKLKDNDQVTIVAYITGG
jgi:sulfur carrier protein ThiS